jgi:viroplasmin and RNaseH domain-containing protein
MAGAKLSAHGADLRELIRLTYKNGGNPTPKTLKSEIEKLAKKHNDKRDQGAFQSFFNSHKIAVQKEINPNTKKSSGKRGRPAKAEKQVGLASRESKTNGHLAGNGFAAFDLGLKFAREVGGLEKAIETLQLIKTVKESI